MSFTSIATETAGGKSAKKESWHCHCVPRISCAHHNSPQLRGQFWSPGRFFLKISPGWRCGVVHRFGSDMIQEKTHTKYCSFSKCTRWAVCKSFQIYRWLRVPYHLFFLGFLNLETSPVEGWPKLLFWQSFFTKKMIFFWSGEYYVHNMYLFLYIPILTMNIHCMHVCYSNLGQLPLLNVIRVFIHIKFACNMTFNCWINHQLIASGKMINSQDWWKETTIILKWSLDILSLGITTENSEILLIRLLMDEFLHHLKGKPCKEWDKLPTSTGQLDFFHLQYCIPSKEIIPTHLFFNPMLPPCLEAPLHHWSTGRPF